MSTTTPTIRRKTGYIAAALAFCAGLIGAAPAQAADALDIVVFGKPSLGAFLPPIIKAHKLDAKNGLEIRFVERPPDAYATQFNSGEFKVGGSAALLSVGIAANRGVKVAYLFNLFDFWGAIVTSNAEIKTLKDLAGKNIAAARGTTNFAMFDWLLRQNGLDTAQLKIVNTATPGLIGYAIADRADAVQLWEPAYSILMNMKPSMRALDLNIEGNWKKFGGGNSIPYLGVAAHEDWINANKPLVPKLFATYKAAADWAVANPADAAILIGGSNRDEERAIDQLLRQKERLGLRVATAAEVKNDIKVVYKAGQSTGYLPAMPADSTIYEGR